MNTQTKKKECFYRNFAMFPTLVEGKPLWWKYFYTNAKTGDKIVEKTFVNKRNVGEVALIINGEIYED